MKLYALTALVAIHAGAEAQELRGSFTAVSFQNDALKSQLGYSVGVVRARRDGRAWRFGYTASERSQVLRTSICSGFCNPQFHIVESVHRRAVVREASVARDFRIVESGSGARYAVSFVMGGHLADARDYSQGDSTGFSHKSQHYAIGPSVAFELVAHATSRVGAFAAIGGASYLGPHIQAEDSNDPLNYNFTAVRGAIGLAFRLRGDPPQARSDTTGSAFDARRAGR